MGKKDKIPHKKVKGTEMVYRSISLPASLVEDLKLLKDSYEDAWKEDEGEKERVTYEKIFERLLSKSGLGHVDPDVYKAFVKAKSTRKEFPAVVTRATRNLVAELAARAEQNGTTLKEEALNEQEEAKATLEEGRRAAAATGDTHAPVEDQGQATEPVATTEVPRDRYFFVKDGEKLEAYTGYWPGFFAKVAGEEREQEEMMADGWTLMNDAGIEISQADALTISTIISAHDKSSTPALFESPEEED